MKREELEALGLTKEQIDSVMTINGNDQNSLKAQITQKDQTITALTTERDGLKVQVADRDKDIDKLKKEAGDNADLNQKLTDLQSKYDTDTKALEERLDKQAKDHAIEQLFSGVKFTSSYAKKAAIAEFREANHEFKDGKYVGANDILKQMQKDNPDAFVTEDDKDKDKDGNKDKEADPAGGEKKPKFTQSLSGKEGDGGGEKNPFKFNFQSVRKADDGK